MNGNNLEMANFNHEAPVISSTMDMNNIVYSSTVDGKLHCIDFVNQTCHSDINLQTSIIKYCSILHSIVANPLHDSCVSMLDIRNNEEITLPIDSGAAIDIHFPFMAVCKGKSIKIFDLLQKEQIHVADLSGVLGFFTSVHFKSDPERGVILGTSGGQVISHNLMDFHFESNEYFSVLKDLGKCYPVNSLNLINDTHLFVTGYNSCQVLDLKQSRKLFEIKPTIDESTQTCSVGCVNNDKSLFSFGITTNYQKNMEAVSASSKIGVYKIDDLREISKTGFKNVQFSVDDPEVVISCEYENNIQREIVVSEMSKISNRYYFDMLRRNRSKTIEKSNSKLDLPNELIAKIIEYLETRYFVTISSINRQFRECLFERNAITIPTLFDKIFFTKFLNGFKHLHTITLKGEAIRCIKALSTDLKQNLKTLVLIAPCTFLDPTIKLSTLTKKTTLENLIIYNCKKFKTISKKPPTSLKKLHLINCGITGTFECFNSVTDLNITGSNFEAPYLPSSLRKLKLIGGDTGEDYRNLDSLIHFTLSVEKTLSELHLSESIQYLDLSGCKVQKILPRLPNLVHLVVDRSDVKADFENLGSLLHLSMKFITDPLAVLIKNKTLSSISFYGSDIESFSIDCPSLTYLNVGNTNIRDEHLEFCLKRNVRLKYLHTPDCKSIENPFKSLETVLDSLCLWNVVRSSVDLTQISFDKLPNIKIETV